MVPSIIAVGAAIDYGRAYMAATTAQGIVDSAAMAGATVFTDSSKSSLAQTTATTFFNTSKATLPNNVTVTNPVVTAVEGSSDCSTIPANTVTVSTTTTVGTTLLSALIKNVSFTVTATGAYPLAKVSMQLTNFDFDATASDGSAIYWYKVPSDGSDPSPTILTKLVDNTTKSNPGAVLNACVGTTQKIGFALQDTPGLKDVYYITNTYGGSNGHSYYYYSSMWPPTALAYPTLKVDTALQIVSINPDGTYPDPTVSTYKPSATDFVFPGTFLDPQPYSGQPQVPPSFYDGANFQCPTGPDPTADGAPMYGCFDSAHKPYTPIAQDGTVTCADLQSQGGIHLYWNDMGPSDEPWNELNADEHMEITNLNDHKLTDIGYDNLNYKDIELSVTCKVQASTPYLKN